MNSKHIRIWEEVVMISCKTLYQYLSGQTEENHKKQMGELIT
jgi:hypothetical protein